MRLHQRKIWGQNGNKQEDDFRMACQVLLHYMFWMCDRPLVLFLDLSMELYEFGSF